MAFVIFFDASITSSEHQLTYSGWGGRWPAGVVGWLMSEVFGGSADTWLVHEPAMSQTRSGRPSPLWSTLPTTSPPHVPSFSQTSGVRQALSESRLTLKSSTLSGAFRSSVLKRRFRFDTSYTDPFDSDAAFKP